jgi:hypothetical protein
MARPSLHDLWSRSVKLGPSVSVTALVLGLVFGFILYRLERLMGPADAPPHLGIDSLINQVRADLENLEVKRESAGVQPLFELQSFDLEVSFVVKQSRKATGSFETEVITVGGEAEHSNEATQRITLHMHTVAPQDVVVPAVKHIDVPSDAVHISSP